MPGCAVATCRNSSRITKGTEIKYFGFPKNASLLNQWINACRRSDGINMNHARICSVHFEKDCFEVPMKHRLLQYNPKNYRYLKRDAVPVLNLPEASQKISNTDRLDRSVKRKQQRTVTEILEDAVYIKTETPTGNGNSELVCKEEFILPTDEMMDATSIQNMETSKNIESSEVAELKKKIKMLEKQNEELVHQSQIANNSIIEKYEKALSKVFTPGQINKLLSPDNKTQKIRWSREDIASAISLHSVSPKAYIYLRENNYPLPALSTLRSYVSTFHEEIL